MATRRNRQTELARLLSGRTAPVDLAERNRLAAAMAPISDRHLRDLLRRSGVPLDCLVEGVRQDSLDQLQRTLCGLAERYESVPGEERLCRQLVIQSKDHAKLAARRMKPGSAEWQDRQEMALWMLTWLENPRIFATWVALRRRELTESRWNSPE